MFWKCYFQFYFVFVRINLFIPTHFWTTNENFDNGCQLYVANCAEIVQVHMNVLGPEAERWNCIKNLFAILFKVMRTNFFADFWSFRNF